MSSANSVVTQTSRIMGGEFVITAVGVNPDSVTNAFTFLKYLENKWSRFDVNSELSKLNNSPGTAVEVTPETVTLVKAMMRGSQITQGYFDPTTLPITVASGYADSRSDKPGRTILPASAKWPGDMLGIHVLENTVTLPVGTAIDAGGIGKGLAADLVIKQLMESGATGALINANGDVVVEGEAPQSGPWIIGIENPLDASIELEQVRLVKGAIATSSKVHQTWKVDGKNVHHLVNPETGSTAVTPVLSASVICASGAEAEALAKIPFILDIDQAINFIESAGAQILIVDENLQLHKSTGWDDFK